MDLLETLAVFIGVVLVLALATQSLQEVLKGVWPVRAQARLGMIRSLLEQSTLASGLHQEDAKALSDEVVRRLRGLGLKGVRRKAVRIDALDVEQLTKLVTRVNPSFVPGLNAVRTPKSKTPQKLLDEIAEYVRSWYSIGMSSVDARTTRRMRWFSLVTSAFVVVSLNVDAIALWSRVSSDAEVRGQLEQDVQRVHGLLEERFAAAEEDPDPGADPPPAADEAEQLARLQETQEELDALTRRVLESGILTGPDERPLDDPDWWLGIAIMTFLVSLGMPFWHETLGALLGIRKRLNSPRETKDTPE